MSEVHYSAAEERLNIWTHAVGMMLSFVGLVFLLLKSSSSIGYITSAVFGLSLIVLYAASTFYHAATVPNKRALLRIFDHAAIYVLIAGTYTPVCLITLSESVGTLLCTVIWSVAVCGVVLKLFFTGRFDKLSTILYVAMGWLAILAIKPLLDSMSSEGLMWLLAGGIFYTVGAVLYSIRSLPFNHAIFHFFVLGGSISHYFMIYLHVV
ncbi:MAG: hemolysin III family protein [Ekhidna sp.]